MILLLLLCIFPRHETQTTDLVFEYDVTYIHRENPQNFTIGPLEHSNRWLRRSRRVGDLMYVWYPMSGKEGPKDVYVRAEYNTSSKLLSAKGIPCGKLPSLSCLVAMLTDLLKIKNATFKDCPIEFPIPTLYNIPRWSIRITTPGLHTYRLESFTLNAVVLTALTLQYHKSACFKQMIPLHVIHNTIMKISTTRSGIQTFFERLPFLNISHHNNTIFEPTDNNTHILAPKFYDIGSLLFYTLYSTSDCRFKEAHNRNIIETKGGVIGTHVGEISIKNLVTRKNLNKKGQNTIINNIIQFKQIKYLDGMILDYLDTLSLYFDAIRKKKHIHKRRSGSISFRGV